MSEAQQERRLVRVAATEHALVHICELSFPSVMVLISADLFGNAVAYNKMGFASFIASLMFGVVALPAGLLCDRIGQRRLILIYLFGAGASLGLLGLVRNYTMLVVALALMMAFIGAYHPAGTSLLAAGTRRRGIAMGWHGVGGSIGLALSPVCVSALAVWLGWRSAYVLLGILPIALGIYILLDKRIGVSHDLANDPAPEQFSNGGKILFVPILFLLMMAILNGMVYRGFTTFLPAYFKTGIKAGFIPGFPMVLQAGSFTTLVMIMSIFGQLLGGRLADRYREEIVYTSVFLISAPLLFLVSRAHGMSIVACAMAFAFFYFINQSVGNTIIPRFVPEGSRGSVYGWFFLVSFSGGSIMSWIAGVVAMRFSLGSIFVLLAGLLFVAGLLGFFLIAAIRSEKQPEV